MSITKTWKICLSISLVIYTALTNAIVIRHDVSDEEYRAELNTFPPLATFYIDGAHGTLIAPKWVITAAHATFCVASGSYISINNELHEVANIYAHPKHLAGVSHDIALIELNQPIENVKPAFLYSDENEQGQHVWFIGIGATGNGETGVTVSNADNSGVLRKAQNAVWQSDGPLLKFRFDEGAHALPLEGISGGGDSGGPAYQYMNGTFRLLGISSRGDSPSMVAGAYQSIEVYSRVSFFSEWINTIIHGDVNNRYDQALPRVRNLMDGLTEENLPEICNMIGLRPEMGVGVQ